MPRILMIDDERSLALVFGRLFEKNGYDFLSAQTAKEGLDLAFRELPDLILLDLYLPDMYGLDVLKELRRQRDFLVIVITGQGEVREAVEAIKLGAGHYLQKPIDLDEFLIMVEKNIRYVQLREEANLLRKSKSPYSIIGRSRQTLALNRIIGLMAANPSATVLIQGETGTGKELVARNIHYQSARAERSFIDINCAAIPDTIFESEFFGYEAGAYTDAKSTKKGLLETADGGTVFLDEIGEMAPNSQAKLLRVLETHSFRRVGSTRDIKVDVRIVAATNKDLSQSVKQGSFREDLFYRLNVLPVRLAPLRERPEDIPMLAAWFAGQIAKEMGRGNGRLAEEAMKKMCGYSWPGNVREMRNVIERSVILSGGHEITAADILLQEDHGSRPVSGAAPAADGDLSLERAEVAHITKVLGLTGGNRSSAARALGISRSTLNEKIKKFGIACGQED